MEVGTGSLHGDTQTCVPVEGDVVMPEVVLEHQ